MAWYDVTYACGHEDIVQLYGKHEDRQRKLEWLSTIDCPECRKKKAHEIAIKANKEFGMPELSGSEKQIAWAEDIRRDWMVNFITHVLPRTKLTLDEVREKCLAMYQEKGEECFENLKDGAPARKIIALLIKTEAKFFIDNR